MNTVYIIIISLLAILLVISLFMFFMSKGKHKELLSRGDELAAQKEVERQRAEELAAALQGKMIDLARAEEEIKKLSEKAEHDKEELEKLQASFRIEFKNLANDILEEKSKQFKEVNKESVGQLLKPLNETISEFRKRVDEIHTDSTAKRGELKNELKNLMDLNKRITEETNNLTSALRGNSKVQGDWGEMILETILEGSNLRRGLHYNIQPNLKDADGNNLRPDVILNMPEGKQVIIDSKVSLTAFVNYTESGDESSCAYHLDEHVRSVRSHVNELGKKSYQEHLKRNYRELINTPEFVIMFIPTEPAFLEAMRADANIWSDAYNKNVVISSPTNLFALLKLVDDLWKRDSQTKNSQKIAEESVKMLDKLVGFVGTLEDVGKNIHRASEGYDKAMDQLTRGRGNLTDRVGTFKKLGVSPTKPLPSSLIPETADEETTDDFDGTVGGVV